MVINKYKTAREYGTFNRGPREKGHRGTQIKQPLPPELVEALQETIRQGELSNRSPLIPVLKGDRAGQAMDAGTFSNFVRERWGR